MSTTVQDPVNQILDDVQMIIGVEVKRIRALGFLEDKGARTLRQLMGTLSESVRCRLLLEVGEGLDKLTEDDLRATMLGDPSIRKLLAQFNSNSPQ